MPVITPASTPNQQKTPCPHCGKPFRTLVKRTYGVMIDGGMKQSVPTGAHWRCMACGKSYTTTAE